MTKNQNNNALIIGGNSAGLQACLDLADSGIKVHLMEETPFIRQSGSNSVPEHIFNTRLLEVSRHPNVKISTNTSIHRFVGELGNFQIELRQNPRYVDLTRCTACGDCIDVCPVTVPGTDHKVIYLDGQPGCMAIDKTGIPPCSNTCPGGIHVQGYVALIAQGRFQEAIDLIREEIPFPGICGRVCTHPCEVNCRRNQIDKPVAVRHLKRFLSDWEFSQESKGEREKNNKVNSSGIHPSPTVRHNSKQVAVVGAGPGGMGVANRLARGGYQVTVFETLPVIGGMMSVGIPAYRLPRNVIAREYQQIQGIGVEIKLNTTIGPNGDHTINDLFGMGYHAVCLAIGAHQGQSLHIPGEELRGVVQGINLLKTINLSQQFDDPKYNDDLVKIIHRGKATRVAVLGGGNTAMDVSRSLKRLNIKEVSILYRRTRSEMPAMPEEVDDAEEEGVSLEYLIAPVRVIDDEQNTVTGLECIRMQLGEPDSSGRRRPVPIAGSEFVMDLDLVVLAIGQNPNFDFMDSDHEILISKDKRIQLGNQDFMTSRPGVFAVGDVVTKDNMTIIEAIGMGKKAATAIDLYLQGKSPTAIPVESSGFPIADREMTKDELIPIPRTSIPKIPIEERVKAYTEVELGYTAEQAIQEANRCLACGPCSECQACVQVCKPNAILHDQRENFVELKIGAIILADYLNDHENLRRLSECGGIYRISDDDPLLGSAVAAQSALALKKTNFRGKSKYQMSRTVNSNGFKPWTILQPQSHTDNPNRIGVFICECGNQIAEYVDTASIRKQAASWPGVTHAQVVPFSCSPDGANTIDSAIQVHNLNRIVLAGCSCCSIDQICYSCTYQRVRCKDNLKLFTHPERSSALGTIDQAIKFVLVNIREQCAWIHTDDHQKATTKAIALVGASVARAMATPTKISGIGSIDHSILICGNGKAGKHCMDVLRDGGISVYQFGKRPERIERTNGKYKVATNGDSCQASALILAPKELREAEFLLAAFGENGYQPRILSTWSDLETHRPGIFYLNPQHDAAIAGAAGAARATAWLSRIVRRPPLTSVVNPTRCRACGTCVEICKFGAPELFEENGHHTSWIDPVICSGCGTCVAHCPSGAITAGYSTDSQIEAMLSVILA